MLSEFDFGLLVQDLRSKNCELLDDDEKRIIFDKRKTYQNRLNQYNSCIDDYVKYIHFERDIFERMCKKQTEMGLERQTVVEEGQVSKIIQVYKDAVIDYPNHKVLWNNFIEFCTTTERVNVLKFNLIKWIGNNIDNPQHWESMNQLEYDNNHYLNCVRTLIINQLIIDPKSTKLYIALFEIELYEASKMQYFYGITTDIIPERALKFYENSKNHIKNIIFIINLLTICEKFPFTKSLQDIFINDLTTFFPINALTWNTLALRELKGYHLIQASGQDAVDGNSYYLDRNDRKIPVKERITNCYEMFIRAAFVAKTTSMWSLFINTMHQINNKDIKKLDVLKKHNLYESYRTGFEENCLTHKQTCKFVGMLYEEENVNYALLNKILKVATVRFSYSVYLWDIFIRIFIMQDKERQVYDKFYETLRIIPAARAIPLWQTLLEYILMKFINRPTKIDTFYSQALEHCEPIGSYFKPKYIEWLTLRYSIQHARTAFDRIYKKKPNCYALHRQMIKLNLTLLRGVKGPNFPHYLMKDIKAAKYSLEVTKHLFGHNRPEVWVELIRFERIFGTVNSIKKLYNQGTIILEDIYVNEFIALYNKMMSESPIF